MENLSPFITAITKKIFPRNAPQITTGGSLQDRGSHECECGRTISANKSLCLACSKAVEASK